MIDYSWVVLFAVLGLVFGSFGTVLICRVPLHKNIGGRSHCPQCRHVLSPIELVPLMSYILQCGRCRHCHRTINALYPGIELSSALLFTLALFLDRSPLPALLLALALWLLLLIAVIDMHTRTIHDVLNFSFVFLAVAYAIAIGEFQAIGALLLGGFFGLQWLLSRGRWVGSGDILLGVGIGFLLGSMAPALLCLGLSYVLGAIVASYLLVTRKATSKSAVPFGPFLAMSTLLTVVFGDRIIAVLILGLF